MCKEDNVNELLPAYALGILPSDERVLVDQHLRTCQECQADLRAYQATANELALASPQSTLLPAVKDKLMRKINARHQQTAAVPLQTPWKRWLGFMQHSAPAWGLVLIFILVLSNGLLWKQLDQVRSQTSNPLHVVALANTKDAPGAIGTLVISVSGEYGTLVVDHLDALDADHQYQLWLIKDGQRSSGGVFSVNPDGYTSIQVYSPQPLSQYQAVGITVEPAGGSPLPTGAKVLGGNIQP
jgi:anti-sigma-K factor RskA